MSRYCLVNVAKMSCECRVKVMWMSCECRVNVVWMSCECRVNGFFALTRLLNSLSTFQDWSLWTLDTLMKFLDRQNSKYVSQILLFDELVGPSWLELENNPLGYDLYALWMGELCCDIVFFSFKKCKSETPLRWYQVKSLKYGDGIQALNQCLDPLGLCQCLLLHCNLFYSCRPAMGMSRSRYGVQSWGGHVWQKR